MQINQYLSFLEKQIAKPTKIKVGSNLFVHPQQFIINKNHNYLFLTDQNIYQKIGKDLYHKLKLTTPKISKKIINNVRKIEHDLRAEINNIITNNNIEYIIACGSGIINDLAKISSYNNNIEYMIFASAPSMNGYLSSNATIYLNNEHLSVSATAPEIAIFDLEILAQAPQRLINSGFADSMSFITSYRDWKLAKFLLNDPDYEQIICDILYENCLLLNDQAKNLQKQDKHAIEILTYNLIYSGLAMRIIGSSKPASQAEHMLAHLYNSNNLDVGYFHGEDISITSFYMDKLQKEILKKDSLNLNLSKIPKLNNHAAKLTKFNSDNLTLISNKIKEWDRIKTIISKIDLKPNKITQTNMDHELEKCKWNAENFRNLQKEAFLSRDRFTFLDLAYLTSF